MKLLYTSHAFHVYFVLFGSRPRSAYALFFYNPDEYVIHKTRFRFRLFCF